VSLNVHIIPLQMLGKMQDGCSAVTEHPAAAGALPTGCQEDEEEEGCEEDAEPEDAE
jgi:hypothetical protein